MSAIKNHIVDIVAEAMGIEDTHADAAFFVDTENVQIAWRAGEATALATGSMHLSAQASPSHAENKDNQ